MPPTPGGEHFRQELGPEHTWSLGGDQGWNGVLPEGVEPHHVGSQLEASDFLERPSVTQDLGHSACCSNYMG